MKGVNEIILNHETMVVAVQHYFDTVLFAAGNSPKVESVRRHVKDGYQSGPDEFRVLANSTPVEEPAK